MHVISKAQEQQKNVELHVVNFVVVVVVMVDFNFVGSHGDLPFNKSFIVIDK